MAKITPSALISEIKGLWSGTVFQMWKGQIVTRNFNPGRMGNKESRQQFQGYISDISGRYYGLSSAKQISWLCYADLLPTQMSGFNAFIARNSTNLLSGHSDLCYFETGPAVYSPPATPSPFSVSFLICSSLFSITWTTPSLSTLFVQAFMAPLAGYSSRSSPSFRLISTVGASFQYLIFDPQNYDTNTVFYFKVRTLNAFGEPSAFSSILTLSKL